MAEQTERTRVAIEYFKTLRTESIERLKMRDQILLSYLGAAAALVGYGQQNQRFNASLVMVIPFLGIGAATMIAQHQDQIVAFSEYTSLELSRDLPDCPRPVIDFNSSTAGMTHLSRNLWMNFIAQLVLICGPPIFILWNNQPYFHPAASIKDVYGILGFLLTLLTAVRIWLSRRFRNRVMSKLAAHAKSCEI